MRVAPGKRLVLRGGAWNAVSCRGIPLPQIPLHLSCDGPFSPTECRAALCRRFLNYGLFPKSVDLGPEGGSKPLTVVLTPEQCHEVRVCSPPAPHGGGRYRPLRAVPRPGHPLREARRAVPSALGDRYDDPVATGWPLKTHPVPRSIKVRASAVLCLLALVCCSRPRNAGRGDSPI